jgi:hypothetical protein
LRQNQHARVIERLTFCARRRRSGRSGRRLSGSPRAVFSRATPHPTTSSNEYDGVRFTQRTRIASAHM